MHMMRTGVAALLGVLLTASAAWAICEQSDVTGTWRVYINGASSDGGFWTWCVVTVGETGAVTGGTACRNSDGDAPTVTGGELTLRSPTACTVRGTVITSDTGTHTVSDAVLDRDGTLLTGVGKDGDGSPWTFTGVKR
jgi:hypothetical protein